MINDILVSIVMRPGAERDDLANTIASWDVQCTAFDSGQAFLDAMPRQRPGCVVIDHDSPDVDGLALQQALGMNLGALPQVIVSGRATASVAVKYMQDGAVTVLAKPCSPGDLKRAIEQAISRDIRWADIQQRLCALRLCEQSLTDRERMVNGMVVRGMPNKIIAREMSVSLRTVEHERAMVFQKFGVDTAAELAAKVTELRVLTELLALGAPSPERRPSGASPSRMAIAC
ncbi:MAG: response regulator [Planctomycetales bacterium]|nr:response regulator [Planctomycetales bacterium]